MAHEGGPGEQGDWGGVPGHSGWGAGAWRPEGWGGAGGYGWAPPPPRPGTIPLAPLDFGQLLGGGFKTFTRYWRPLTAVVVTAYGAFMVIGAAALAIAYAAAHGHLKTLTSLDGAPAPASDLHAVVAWAVVLGVLGLVALVTVQSLVTAACAVTVQDGALGRATTYRAVLGRSLRRLGPALGASAASWLLGLVPAALFMGVGLANGAFTSHIRPDPAPILIAYLVMIAGSAVVVWPALRIVLAPTVAVVESCGPRAALRRSWTLVGGAWWRTLGVLLVAGCVAGFAAGFVNVVLEVLGIVGTAGAFAASDGSGATIALASVLIPVSVALILVECVIMLYPQLVLALVYVDRRMRTENLAEVLIRSV
ncbi:hypothetical protein [Streptomyces montanisoli]|uniref:Glycerophosphoryl diester phosphodiesterase membrane domain-containing protein n=1 Tax=Streptomyces montanisoli TaxID=2798581 RepID=A0A940MHN0_9ACTN|nr:hypothetical protein [Streptomyces montanisoli]MBP0459391.1 hypothetical protein [Streptomyces montanisoli]